MDNLFHAGHRQLIDAQAGGLAQAWQRAAADAARAGPVAAAGAPAARRRRHLLGGMAVAGVLGVALLLLMQQRGGDAGVPTASVAGAAPIAVASTEPVPATDAGTGALPRR